MKHSRASTTVVGSLVLCWGLVHNEGALTQIFIDVPHVSRISLGSDPQQRWNGLCQTHRWKPAPDHHLIALRDMGTTKPFQHQGTGGAATVHLDPVDVTPAQPLLSDQPHGRAVQELFERLTQLDRIELASDFGQ